MNLISRNLNILDQFLSNFTSEATKNAYRKDLKEFMTFVHTDLTSNRVIAYRDSLIHSGKSSATVNRKLAAVKSLTKWCVSQGYMAKLDFLEYIKLPRIVVKNPTTAFSDEEVQKILGAIDTSTFYGNTHKIVMLMLFYLGLRRSELTHIKLSDFFEDRGTIILRIVGKGQKERSLPLTPELKAAILNYFSDYKKLTNKELFAHDYLLQSSPFTKNLYPMDGSNIFKIVNKYAKAVGITRRVGAHSCRATVISSLLERNVSPRDVADFAGHTNIQTTIGSYDKKRLGIENSAAMKVKYGA